MTWANRFRLTLGLVAVLALGAWLTFYLNESKAIATSSSAQIESQTYAVGSQYAGLVVDQLVEQGDAVTEGTPLFVIDSAPATTAVRGMLSVSCSSRSRATTLRGLPRTIAWDWTQSSRSPLAS
jgi:multidrug resistance efflux pump